jgi:hypothetical protein
MIAKFKLILTLLRFSIVQDCSSLPSATLMRIPEEVVEVYERQKYLDVCHFNSLGKTYTFVISSLRLRLSLISKSDDIVMN